MNKGAGTNELPKWTVTINRWDVFVLRGIVAASASQAEDLAVEQLENDDGDCEHEDGGINSIEVEEEEE